MRVSEIPNLLRETAREWSEDRAPTLGAALAYFTLFSLAPLLIIAIAVAGFVLGQQAASGQLYEQISGAVGAESARAIQSLVASANKPTAGIIGTIVGTVTLLLGAAGVFGQLKESMNIIWEAEPKRAGGVMGFVKDKFLSFTMVLGVGFLLLVSLILSALFSAFAGVLGEALPVLWPVFRLVNVVVSLIGTTLLFAMIFKVLPDVEIAWRDVWLGAVVTAILFAVGKELIALYMGLSNPASAYGAAGSLVGVLIWIYYSAQILFFGAEFTQVYARKHGSRLGYSTTQSEPLSAEVPKVGEQEARKRLSVGPGGEIPEQQGYRARSPMPAVGYLAALALVLAGSYVGTLLRKR